MPKINSFLFKLNPLQDGMQKEIFQKFVTKLNEHCENVLIGSEIDYRRVIAQNQRSKDQVSVKRFSNCFSLFANPCKCKF